MTKGRELLPKVSGNGPLRAYRELTRQVTLSSSPSSIREEKANSGFEFTSQNL
jgi:hypothetical protein